MSRTSSLLFLFTLLASILVVPVTSAVAADSGDEIVGERYESVPIPEGLTKEDIRDAIAQVLGAREWLVKQKTDRRVVGYLKHRGTEATVTILFDGENAEIYCDGWVLDRSGARKKPEQPRGWLGNLQRDLKKKFAVMAAAL